MPGGGKGDSGATGPELSSGSRFEPYDYGKGKSKGKGKDGKDGKGGKGGKGKGKGAGKGGTTSADGSTQVCCCRVRAPM